MNVHIEEIIDNYSNEKEKPEWFCKSSELSLEDQKWIWDNILHEIKGKEEVNDNTSVSGSVNGTYEHDVKLDLTQSKHKVITELEQCNYRTSPKKIASLLERLLVDYHAKEGHWLYVAQNWTPRAINRVIKTMIKQHQRGEKTIDNAAAYFTYLIKFRKKRKEFMGTNDTYKQQI